MPSIRWADETPDGKKRTELIKQILPKKSIIDSFLQPRLMEAMSDILIKALKKEIEVYKAYPKKGQYDPGTFDTRSTDTCFMGQGFKGNGFGVDNWYDAELQEYRKAIGTMHHMEWGNCTLLEIWGGDHYMSHKEMVVGVMEYAFGIRKTMPELHFYVNPFFKNKKSGEMVISSAVKEDRDNALHLNKIADYIEIRDRLKKAGITNPLNLGLTEEDDPPPEKQRNFDSDYDANLEEEDD